MERTARWAMVACAVVLVFCVTKACRGDEAEVHRATGDVVAVKPDGAEWGRFAHGFMGIFTIKRVQDRHEYRPGEPFPSLAAPYQLTDAEDRLLARSVYKIDPNADDRIPLKRDGPGFRVAQNLKVLRALETNDPSVITPKVAGEIAVLRAKWAAKTNAEARVIAGWVEPPRGLVAMLR